MMKRIVFALLLLASCFGAYKGHAQGTNAESYTDYFKKPDNGNIFEAKTKYDYKKLAEEMTTGCQNDYERIKAIYGWICSHIQYDTSYKIRTADECMKQGKGVCQAYCELFYLLGKALNIRVETIEGKVKDQTGYVNPAGHGWLFAYTRENHGILMDPTWGAGSVEGDKFVPEENCWQWFNVAPEWMILSHLPNKQSCQLLKKPISEKEFLAFSPFNPLWLEYGLDLQQIYEQTRGQTLVLPQFYNDGNGIIAFQDIPHLTSLSIGVQYTFRIKMLSDREFAIRNGSVVCGKNEWTDEGGGVFSVKFVPRETESLSICIKDAAEGAWSTIVKYQISPPTQTEWDLLATYYPLSTPEMKAVKNLNAVEWGKAGVTELSLAQLIKENGVTELPLLYDGRGQQLVITAVPMSRQLKQNETYAFSIKPQTGYKWAIVNGQDWYTDWEVSENGVHSMKVTPKSPGKLSLFVQMADGEGFWPCLEYVVQ